jgi:bifunctional non-homologous end joining protein LigD
MPKRTFPDFVPPMMAESTKAEFDSPDWIFEIKLDGYRAITVFDSAGTPHLWSRNGLALEAKFPAVATAVSKLKLRSTILDGEVVAVDEMGYRVFSFCKGSKSNQRRRLSTMSLTSFGITETTLRVTQSLNVGACSNVF